MRPWSKLPSWWYRPESEVLISLRGGTGAGASQAALRVYLGLGAADRDATSFAVAASLSDLEDLTGLSRGMVLRGVHEATKVGLINYKPGERRHRSTFELLRAAGDDAGGWLKLPNKEVRERVLRLPHRGSAALAALKLYMLLLAGRPNDNMVVALRHKTLREKSDVQANQVRSAISLLANEGLLHVITEDYGDEYRVQRYQLVGRLEAPRRWHSAGAAADALSQIDTILLT
jgi:hypothetical protein